MITQEALASVGDEEAFKALLRKIERERLLPCAGYKDRCLRRRISVRMRANAVHTFGDYSSLLDRNGAEWEKLMAALTINVTRFFRDPTAFATLEAEAYPTLQELFPGKLRVWSAGCSHGHEPYSLAIGMAERFGVDRFAIDATDIDADSLIATSAGSYSDEMLVPVSAARRAQWFNRGEPAVVRDTLRRTVSVARHDLLREAMPAESYNLITCRNVIIYFSREAQSHLFTRLYNALVPGGLLMLGKVETLVGPARERFTTLNMRERLFQRPLA